MILIDTVFAATDLDVRLRVHDLMDNLGQLDVTVDFQASVEIIIVELLNNIVEHSYADTDFGMIVFKVSLLGDRLRVETNDTGTAMPDLKAPNPNAPNLAVDPADMPEGQFGWFLIRKLSEELEYNRVENENRLSLYIAK